MPPSAPRAVDVLLVGGGVSAVRCARALRREGFDGSILLVGAEDAPPYNRPPLSKELLRDDLPDELVVAEPERWYARREVSLVTGMAATGLDPARRTVTLADGTAVAFERCLLATGAAPRRLPVPGGDRALLLRTLADARAVRGAAVAAGSGAHVAVVGGGFIGVEVASSLATLGLRVTIVELSDRLWSGAIGERTAAWAADRLSGIGIGLRLRSSVTAIDDGVVWIGEERLPADLVVAGIGVEPRVSLAVEAGLAVEDGIVTDAAQRTSHAAIWAAGDVARTAGARIEHWHAAREAGERAARSMLGLPVPPIPPSWFFSEVAGVPIDVIGSVAPGAEERQLADGLVAFVEGGRVVALVVIDAALPPDSGRALLAGGATPDEVAAAAARA